MASLISPNFSSYEISGQPRQKFSPKLECSSNPKMFFHSCTVDLLSTNSASEASMVKHVKFNHVLDTIFCWFWAESVQCEVDISLTCLTYRSVSIYGWLFHTYLRISYRSISTYGQLFHKFPWHDFLTISKHLLSNVWVLVEILRIFKKSGNGNFWKTHSEVLSDP